MEKEYKETEDKNAAIPSFKEREEKEEKEHQAKLKKLEDEENELETELKTLAEAVRAQPADGRVFASQASSSEGRKRVSLQVFLQENVMLILLGAFAVLTDWFSFWEMNIDEPSQYTIPLLCKRLLLASASVSTALLVLKWCLEYAQMNATLVQRKKGPLGDIESNDCSRLIKSGVDSPQGTSATVPIITRFDRPPPPRWLVRMITVLSGISVLNDSIDFINVMIILCANPGASAIGTLICNLFLNSLNVIASAYEAMGFEASQEKMQEQLAQNLTAALKKHARLEDSPDTLLQSSNRRWLSGRAHIAAPIACFCGAMGALLGAIPASWIWAIVIWFGGVFWYGAVLLFFIGIAIEIFIGVETHCLIPRELLKVSEVNLSDYIRLGLLHVLIPELVDAITDWITFFSTAVFSERVPTWLWRLYFLSPLIGTFMLYPSLLTMLEAKVDARSHREARRNRLCSILCEDLLGLVCNVLFLCYPTYQLQLLPIANIILTVAVVSCQLITEFTGLQHAKLIDYIDQIRQGDTGRKSMGERIANFCYPQWGYQKRDAFMAVKTLLDGGADPNMACGEPLHRAVMAKTETDSDSPLVWDAERVATRIFNTVELLLEAGARLNLGTRQLAGGLVVAPLDEVVIQPELQHVAALLKANGARHSDDYYKYGGHTNQPRYAALLTQSTALDRQYDKIRDEMDLLETMIKEQDKRREKHDEDEKSRAGLSEKEREDQEKKAHQAKLEQLRDQHHKLQMDLWTSAEAVRAEPADGRVFASQASSSQGPRRLPLQVFLRENVMLILLGAFAALTDWFSFWEMSIDVPSQYTVPFLSKRLLLASASVSTALLVLKWCLEYVQMNATLVQRKKGQSGDIELSGRSRLIDSGVDSQAATPRGPSPTAPIITRFHRPPPPRWLVRMITVLSGISVLNDIIDFINVVIILHAIGNLRSHAIGILISNLSLNLLNAIASAYKAMGFEASQLAQIIPEDPEQTVRLFAVIGLCAPSGVVGALCAYWGWSWIGGFFRWSSIMLMLFLLSMLMLACLLGCATCLIEVMPGAHLFHYHRLGLLHVLIAELVSTTTAWITFFTIAVVNKGVPTWLWRLYFLWPVTETWLLYPSLLTMLEAKVDARAQLMFGWARLSSILCEDLLGLICNVLFLCYPTYQLQLLPLANIILTVAVIGCHLTRELTALQHIELIDRIDQIRKGYIKWKSMRQRMYDFFGVRYQEGTADALVAVKRLLDGGADPNTANGEPLYRAVMAETETDSSDRWVWDAKGRVATRIYNTVELLLEAGGDPNLRNLFDEVKQPELQHVAALLKANGARHSDDYYKYGGHTSQPRYAAPSTRPKGW
ncbi:unnamed protein product [Vitrella brassicaformis CCMP3155]|uniref:Uncharacterized protein n=1 Tax=Vitrella brassicaformis (strain CCMP3155) TaxID=1169540 RepID=A0A0G4EQ81_VITBC|nr:unnamed protein product [Vitrella brassicaformis CCMP3155]|eukprot:CEL99447.1 unnamed protein product [Vitrella brassicaformis CCMP3155]